MTKYLSGSTNSESSHTHTRGTMEITGSSSGFKCVGSMSARGDGAFSFVQTGKGGDYTSTSDKTSATLTFTASSGWTGSTSAGSAHSHSFSNVSITFGSGSYTRPYSLSCLMFIKY